MESNESPEIPDRRHNTSPASLRGCFEPSQPQRITSGLKINVNLSPSYSLHCKTFHIKNLNNSLKTFHTNISLTHFISCKTHQSLAKKSKNISGITFRKSEYKDLSSKHFFLISNKSAHSIKVCLTVITALHAPQTVASSFLKIKECVK